MCWMLFCSGRVMLSSLWDETLGGPTGVSSFCSDRWQQREFLRLQWRTLSCTRWLQSQAVVLTTHTPGSVCSCPNLGWGVEGGALSLIQIWKRAWGGKVVTCPGLHGGTSCRSHLQGGTLDHDPPSFPVPCPDPQSVSRQGGQLTAHPAS